jgi:hypothetical protein
MIEHTGGWRSRSFLIVFVMIPHMWSGDGGSVSMIRIALDIKCYWYRTHLPLLLDLPLLPVNCNDMLP